MSLCDHSNCVNFFTLTMQAALRAVLKQGEIVCLFIYLFIYCVNAYMYVVQIKTELNINGTLTVNQKVK